MSIDEQIRQELDHAVTGARGQFETALRAVVQDMTRAAAEERTRAVAAAAEQAAAEVRQKAHNQLATLRDAAQKHHDELRRAADAQINELKRALDETRRRAQADVEDARRTAQAQVDDVQRTLEQRIGELQARLGDMDRRLAQTTRDLETARKAAAAEAEELVVAQLASAAAETDRRMADAVDQERHAARQRDQEQTTRLTHAVRMLDDARSLGEVLEVLTQCGAREAERVALLVAKGDRLTGWSLVGFGDRSPSPRAIDLSPDTAGLVGLVLRTGSPASRNAAEPDRVALPPFANDAGSRDALALPIIVGGATVAVLYADSLASDRRGSDRWAAILDVLSRHASKVLEALTVQQVVGLSLPRPMARASHDAVAGLRHDRGVQ